MMLKSRYVSPAILIQVLAVLVFSTESTTAFSIHRPGTRTFNLAPLKSSLWDEYMAKKNGGTPAAASTSQAGPVFPAAAPVAPADPVPSYAAPAAPVPVASTPAAAAPAMGGTSMRSTFDELSSRITSKLGLQATDFTETYGGQTWSCPTSGVSGTAEWMSESSPKFLTGVSFCTRTGGASGEELMINVWMGPSYDVPHMLLTFGQQPSGTYAVSADYVVRGGTPIGSDPQMLEAYYGAETCKAWTTARASAGATPLSPPTSFSSRLISSPASIAVGGLTNASDAVAIAVGHVDRFLSWLDVAQPVMARSRGAFNLRDDKLRQYFYRGEVEKNVREFGESLGPVIGAVNTGPTAEAYVGGGS